MYVAIERFADLMDGKRLYEAGDAYPRLGLNVTPERLAELAGSDNRMGRPVIVDAEADCESCRVDGGEAPAESPAKAEAPAEKARSRRRKKVDADADA